ncbi:hypothetical protein IQ252_04530 [Tychonema sp. LEGE 07203]|nr:hypothetical protein [Tychonema sp. LEGE 07203]
MAAMQEEDAITLHAFSEALRKFDSSLPEELIIQINQVGQQLAANTSNVDQFAELYRLTATIKKNPEYARFYKLYRDERRCLQQPYNTQERGKAIQNTSSLLPFAPLENVAGDISYLNTYKPSALPERANTNTNNATGINEAEVIGRGM